MKNYIDYLLDEGLIKTYDLDLFIQKLNKLFHSFGIYNCSYDINGSTLKFKIEQQIDSNVFEQFQNYLKTFGYFISFIYVENRFFNWNDFINDKRNISKYLTSEFIIEAIYDKSIENLTILYHCCKEENLEKILEIGLVPKNKNKTSYHPERIFLSENYNIKSYTQYKSIKNTEYVILEIDIKDLYINNFNGTKDLIKIYKDPNSNGFYTLDNIPKERIIQL